VYTYSCEGFKPPSPVRHQQTVLLEIPVTGVRLPMCEMKKLSQVGGENSWRGKKDIAPLLLREFSL